MIFTDLLVETFSRDRARFRSLFASFSFFAHLLSNLGDHFSVFRFVRGRFWIVSFRQRFSRSRTVKHCREMSQCFALLLRVLRAEFGNAFVFTAWTGVTKARNRDKTREAYSRFPCRTARERLIDRSDFICEKSNIARCCPREIQMLSLDEFDASLKKNLGVVRDRLLGRGCFNERVHFYENHATRVFNF